MQPLVLTLALGLLLAGVLFAADTALPDPLIMEDGTKVTTREAWTARRRPEVLDLFRTNIYGRVPVERPDDLIFEVVETVKDAMAGTATLKRINVNIQGPGGKVVLHLSLFVPETEFAIAHALLPAPRYSLPATSLARTPTPPPPRSHAHPIISPIPTTTLAPFSPATLPPTTMWRSQATPSTT